MFLIHIAKHLLEQDFREADDGIERSAQLMGHVRQELGFVLAGDFELSGFFLQLLEESCILNGGHGLCGEGLQQVHRRFWELARGFAPDD